MTRTTSIPEYVYESNAAHPTFEYLLRPVERFLPVSMNGLRVLDIGCGNGAWVGWFLARGAVAMGVDPSPQGIAHARSTYPSARFEVAEAGSDILQHLGEEPFDVVISTEVVEHVYAPREWADACCSALKPGGRLICSTPYHGYLKNIAIAVTGKWDSHHGPLWDGGHIKFWSRATLSRLLEDAGFTRAAFLGAGRFPLLWKSMVLCADRR